MTTHLRKWIAGTAVPVCRPTVPDPVGRPIMNTLATTSPNASKVDCKACKAKS